MPKIVHRADGYGDYHARRLRAAVYVKEKVVEGRTLKEIAARHGVHYQTVRNTLTWAEKAGLFLELEDQILAELGPLAVNAIKEALITGKDVPKGAIELLQGLNILKKNHPITAKDVKESDDLAAYIHARRERAALQQATVPGELIERQPQLISGYSPELLGAGDPADAPRDGAGDPERVSGGVGGPHAEATAEKGEGSGENRVSLPEGTAPDGPAQG